MPSYRLATREDCIRMAPKLRKADQQEIEAGGYTDHAEALLSSFDGSQRAFCIEHNGEPIAVYGVAPAETWSDSKVRLGVCWMLATDGLRTHWRWFLRHSLEIVAMIEGGYDALFNLVDARNTVHIRWVEWCGFKQLETVPYGVNGEPFIQILKVIPCATSPQD